MQNGLLLGGIMPPMTRKEKPMSHPCFAAFRTFVKQLNVPWHRYQKANLLLLGAAFLQRRSLPVRRLARALAGPGKAHRACDKRLRRFLGNRRLDEAAQEAAAACLLRFVLARLGAVPFVPVMVDWLFVDDHAILGLQVPYRGRSLPLGFAVHSRTLSDDEERQTAAEQKLVERLLAYWPDEAPPPVLLCDRGFDKRALLSFLLERKVRFIVRIQTDHHLYDRRGRLLNDRFDPALGFLRPGRLHPPLGKARLFAHVTYYQQYRLQVHLVVTAKADPKTGQRREWRLVTNLPGQYLRHVPRLYAQRMSPEETHRDLKGGASVAGFALSHLGRMRADRLQRYLLIVALLACFLVLVAETEREAREWLCRKHWGIGLLTMGLELLHAAGTAANQLARRACASVTLQPLWLPGGDS
jgi:hypothetical protein